MTDSTGITTRHRASTSGFDRPSESAYRKANGNRTVSASPAAKRNSVGGAQPETPQKPSSRTTKGPLGHHRG